MFEWFKKYYTYENLIILCLITIALLSIINFVKKRYYKSNMLEIDIIKAKKKRPPQVSKGEAEAKRVLEKIFNVPFEKVRPDFLRNGITKNNLELDLFNPGLGLGVEFNGAQHYNYNKFFHKNKEAFYNQKYRDYIKKRLCQDNGITLIDIPYTVKPEMIEKFLISELYKKGFVRG